MLNKESYFTVPCRSFNPTSQYQKQIRLYDKKLWLFLPNEWVYLMDTETERRSYQNLHIATNGKHMLMAQLSDEQTKIMARVEKRIKDFGYSSWIINMKTGRGKTMVMTEIGNRLDWKVLILCHNEVNCKMMVEHYRKFYPDISTSDIGFAYGGKYDIKDITIATHRTFWMHPELFTDFSVILYDEMHKNISDITIKALCKMKSCKALYGFSGTPYRDDLHTKDLEKIFGKEITVEGYSLPEERYNMLPTLYVEEYITPWYDYVDYHELRNCAMNDDVRTGKQMECLVKYLERFNRTCCLVFTDRVSEAETYEKTLRKNPSLSVVLMHWGINTAQSLEELAKARTSGKPIVIVWTIQKIGTGVDFPYIDAVFFFSPTKFNGAVVQWIGRWLRLSEWKKDIILVDWHDQDKWILHRQHLARIKVCKKEYGAVVNTLD